MSPSLELTLFDLLFLILASCSLLVRGPGGVCRVDGQKRVVAESMKATKLTLSEGFSGNGGSNGEHICMHLIELYYVCLLATLPARMRLLISRCGCKSCGLLATASRLFKYV
jgi:hypothetical protein